MWKNIVIIILLLSSILTAYCYITTRRNLNVLRYSAGREQFQFYPSPNNFSVISTDNNLTVHVNYDEHGVKSLGLRDILADKEMGFNFSDDSVLTSYHYRDENYFVATNIYGLHETPLFIVREEWYGRVRTLYDLYSDGTTEIRSK